MSLQRLVRIRLTAPKIPIQNLFKPRKFNKKTRGDGKSFETAIDLTSAPTLLEQTLAIYDHLEREGEKISSQQTDQRNGQFFDVIKTRVRTH